MLVGHAPSWPLVVNARDEPLLDYRSPQKHPRHDPKQRNQYR